MSLNSDRLIKKFTNIENSKLHLLDGAGAVISAAMHGLILASINSYVGLTVDVLHGLAYVAVIFVIYDLFCYIILSRFWRKTIRVIAVANLVFCLISILIIFNNRDQLTILGWGYFIVEIVIVSMIAIFEIKMSYPAREVNLETKYYTK